MTRYSEEDLTVMQNKVRKGSPPTSQATKVSPEAPLRASASAPYRSKWEAAYASRLELDKRAGLIKAYWHEPFSLWLPGKVRYKPDFLVQYKTIGMSLGTEQCLMPQLELIEVKGWSKNRRDGMTRLKIAAALFPCFVWRLVYRTQGGGWDGEYI